MLTDGKQTETNGGGLTKIDNRSQVELKISERKKLMKKKISALITDLEILWGVEIEQTRQDVIIKNLVNDEFIISDVQFANAKAWLYGGDRTYMGRNSTKLLLSDFSPTPTQLRSLESDSVRILTKQELALMLEEKRIEGLKEGIRFPYKKKDDDQSEAAHSLIQENLKISKELMEVKKQLRDITTERDSLLMRNSPISFELLKQLENNDEKNADWRAKHLGGRNES